LRSSHVHRIYGIPGRDPGPFARVSVIPVTQLRPGDHVFDTAGMDHPLASVELGIDATVWIQRNDLPCVEHLTGAILVARPRDQWAG
jgi:hypothetical protein